jgi:hypothetical protein
VLSNKSRRACDRSVRANKWRCRSRCPVKFHMKR